MNRRVSRLCLAFSLASFWIAVVGSQTGCDFDGTQRRGRQLFGLHCAPCHEEANPDLKKQPPRLEGLFQSAKLPSGAPATDEQVRKTVIQGIGTMPAFDQRLSSDDLDNLVKYLHTLK